MRVLSRFSAFDIGDNDLKPVNYHLKIGGMRGVLTLATIYFCKYDMTFDDDILEDIGITEEFRIQKPGVNIDLCISFISRTERYVKFLKKISSRSTSRRGIDFRCNVYFIKHFLGHKFI